MGKLLQNILRLATELQQNTADCDPKSYSTNSKAYTTALGHFTSCPRTLLDPSEYKDMLTQAVVAARAVHSTEDKILISTLASVLGSDGS